MSDGDVGDSGKTLSISEEFAKAKRNVMFWCVLCYVAALSQLLPSEGTNGTVRLLYLDVKYPHWAIQLGCLAIATYMLMGYLRAEGRTRRENSSLAREYDSARTDAQLRIIDTNLQSIHKQASGTQNEVAKLRAMLEQVEDLRAHYLQPAFENVQNRTKRARNEIDQLIRYKNGSALNVEAEISSVADDFSDAVARWENDLRTISSKEVSLNDKVDRYGEAIEQLRDRLADLQAYFADIDEIEIKWHSEFDRRLVRFSYGAAALLVACAIIWFPNGPGEALLNPLSGIAGRNH